MSHTITNKTNAAIILVLVFFVASMLIKLCKKMGSNKHG